MEGVTSILQAILESDKYDQESLARLLGVSPSAVSRWISGSSKPRPIAEGKLREIYASLAYEPQLVREPVLDWPAITHEPEVRSAINMTLRELREILHRRGRLSSRNEALDEISKLLFAHIMSIADGSDGINSKTMSKNRDSSWTEAVALKAFVDRVFQTHLPHSLSAEMRPADFELRLKPQENAIALEIIECFEQFAGPDKLRGAGGIYGVDVLNEVFGQFLADSFVDEKQLGQYLTPSEVVRFMVRLALEAMPESELSTLLTPSNCTEFGLILDPSCGVGSFLTETMRTLYHDVEQRHDKTAARKWLETMSSEVLVGIDKSERMIRLALTSMAMFGLPAGKLHLANALARSGPDSRFTKELEGKVKLILTNPPFGAEFEGSDLLDYKISTGWSQHAPVKVDSELLFIERYLDWLAPGGQFLAIVPDSILTNRGMYEELRQHLADQIDIRSIISLPAVTFSAAGTSTKTSILHIQKPTKSRPSAHKTFFAICNDIGYSVSTKSAQRTKTANGEGELPRILEEFSGEAALNYGRQVIDVEKAARWDATFHASLSLAVEQRLKNRSKSDVFLSDIAELSSERTDPRRWGTGTFRYIEISDVDTKTCTMYANEIPCSDAPSRARKLVRAGDVLFATVRPERRTVGVARENQDGVVCTTGFAVIRPRRITSMTLAYLLKSDFVISQIMRNNIGIAYPAIDEGCLRDVLLPIKQDDLDALKESSDTMLDLEKKLEDLRGNFLKRLQDTLEKWEEVTPREDSKHHQSRETKSHPQAYKVGSDSHDLDKLPLWASHKT